MFRREKRRTASIFSRSAAQIIVFQWVSLIRRSDVAWNYGDTPAFIFFVQPCSPPIAPRLRGRFGRPRRRDLAQRGGEAILGAFKLILGLNAHPKSRRGSKISREPQGGVGGQRGLLPDQPLNSRARHSYSAGERVRGKIHRAKEFLAQDLTGMNRGSFLAMAARLSMIVHDLDLLRSLIAPPEYDPPLVVDPDRMLAGEVAGNASRRFPAALIAKRRGVVQSDSFGERLWRRRSETPLERAAAAKSARRTWAESF